MSDEVYPTVRHRLLHSHLRLFLPLRPRRWIWRQPYRVFDDDGHFGGHCCEPLQRTQYEILDRLGILRRVCWHCAYLCIHRMFLLDDLPSSQSF